VASDGSICEWVGTISDIEDQRQAELSLGIAQTELAKQKRELELIKESAPVGMSLLDREYRFLRINETLARFNGFTLIYRSLLTDVEIVGTTTARLPTARTMAASSP